MRISDWSSDVCSSDLNPIPTPAPDAVAGTAAVGVLFGLGETVVYPWWRLVYLGFSLVVIGAVFARSEEHTSELQSLMRISYAVFCLKKKKNINDTQKE